MKYYVSYGDKMSKVSLAGNHIAPCINLLKELPSDQFDTNMPTHFRVSQRGFDEHDDDQIVSLQTVLSIMQLANNPEGEALLPYGDMEGEGPDEFPGDNF